MTSKKTHANCKFMKTCKTLDLMYPPDKKFSHLRRIFREFLLISEENGRKCCTPMGNAGYIFQKEKQLTQYFYMIHPYSKFCECWETLAVIEFFVGLTIRTFLISQLPNDTLMTLSYQISFLLADLFETTDVWLRFVIGYIDKETQTVVLDPRKVFKHIICKFSFYLDVIVSLPLEFAVYAYTLVNGQPNLLFRYCVFLKIFKLYSMSLYLSHSAKIHNWSDLTKRLVWVILFSFIFLHFLSCVFHGVIYNDRFIEVTTPLEKNHNHVYYYLRAFYIVSCIYFGHYDLDNQFRVVSFNDKFLFAFLLILLHLVNTLILGAFIQLLGLRKTSWIAYEELKQKIQKFLAQENLPKRIHKKVMKYLEFRYCQKYFNENHIFKTISPPLKRDILNFLCFKLLKHPESIFRDIPDDMASNLCMLMKYKIYLPGDAIFRVGKKANSIYFIYSGSVAVYSPQGKEITHFYVDQQFGTSAFLAKFFYPVTAIALEMTECYSLRYTDFLSQAADNPECISMVTKNARDRLKYITGLFLED